MTHPIDLGELMRRVQVIEQMLRIDPPPPLRVIPPGWSDLLRPVPPCSPLLAAEAETAATVPPVLVRDVAEALGTTVPEVCAALIAAGRPQHSTNMAVSGEDLVALAAVLRRTRGVDHG